MVCLFSHASLCTHTRMLSLYNTYVVWVCVLKIEGFILSAHFGLLSASLGDICLFVMRMDSSLHSPHWGQAAHVQCVLPPFWTEGPCGQPLCSCANTPLGRFPEVEFLGHKLRTFNILRAVAMQSFIKVDSYTLQLQVWPNMLCWCWLVNLPVHRKIKKKHSFATSCHFHPFVYLVCYCKCFWSPRFTLFLFF